MYYRYISKSLKLALCSIFSFILISPTNIQSQTDEIFSKFLLNQLEMIGYKLESQFRNDWIVGEDNQLHKSIRQTWISDGVIDSKEMTVEICVFNSIAEAINGTAYSSGTYSEFFIWGSFGGGILGDGLWISAQEFGNAMILVRGNVGVHIGAPFAKREEHGTLEAIAYKILGKIEENLSQEILSTEEAIRQKRGPFDEYQKITKPVVNSKIMSGFSIYNRWDSKWLIESSSLTMGIRKEWKNEQGSLIGINICKFNSDSIAAKAATTQGRMTYSRVFNLDNLDSLKLIINEWQNMKQYSLTKNLFSVVGVKGNIAVHVYQFDIAGIDTNFFYSIVEKLSEHISNY